MNHEVNGMNFTIDTPYPLSNTPLKSNNYANQNPSLTALNGFNQGAEKLNSIAGEINNNLTNNFKSSPNNALDLNKTPYTELINQAQQNHSLEQSLTSLVTNKTQMLALLKVIDVDKNLEQSFIGKAINTTA